MTRSCVSCEVRTTSVYEKGKAITVKDRASCEVQTPSIYEKSKAITVTVGALCEV
jgi:hypothetical protein